MIRCVISQPRFFPGLHYLHRLLVADVFVVLDNVQYNPRHEENRTKLKSTSGTQWLTVPMTRTHREQLIVDTRPANDEWRPKAKRTLEHLYGASVNFDTVMPTVETIIDGEHDALVDLDLASWGPAIEGLDVSAKIVRASELAASGKGGEHLLAICTEVGADIYLSGGFGRQYLDGRQFGDAGVALEFHQYEYPEYQQQFDGFEPYVSYLDMAFNVGLNRDLVESGDRTEYATARSRQPKR